MNIPDRKSLPNQTASVNDPSAADATLRLIASLPSPDGLEDRIQAGVQAAPRQARILAWPSAHAPAGGWMRAAAAASIVFVVAGGGWGVYSHVQQPSSARVIVLPPHGAAQGGFSSAGAMRTPQTLNGPVLAHPATPQPVDTKAPAHTPIKPLHNGQPAPANKTTAQPAAPNEK
jgi:hypothetical protein